MSSYPNYQLTEQLYTDFAEGNLEAVFARIHEDVDWIIQGDPKEIPISGVFKGHEEVMDLFKNLFGVLDISQNYPDQILINGDVVAAIGSVQSTVRATGKPHSTRFVDLMTFANGKIVRYERMFDTLGLYRALQP